MFRRRSKVEAVSDDGPETEVTDEIGDETTHGTTDAATTPDRVGATGAAEPGFVDAPGLPSGPPVRPTGPLDLHDVPEDDETERLDLGALHIPVPDGLEVRVDVHDGVIMAATVVDGDSELQVHAFAAPRSSGLWDEVRDEIAESLRESGGSAEDVEGTFGTELRGRIPVEGGEPPQPARFLGVDGPRWFVRALVTGPAATDPAAGLRLEEAFRGVVVDRGTEAMTPRDMLPLALPADAADQLPPPPDDQSRTLELPERGPEITEIQ